MLITYDPEANAVYIKLVDAQQADHGVELEDGVIADVDAQGHVVGIQVLDATHRLGPDPLNVRLVYLGPDGQEQPRPGHVARTS
jgi:uncharacterized protein YuzE